MHTVKIWPSKPGVTEDCLTSAEFHTIPEAALAFAKPFEFFKLSRHDELWAQWIDSHGHEVSSYCFQLTTH